ncbi:MAG: group II truncated hemoglobin [Pseudomonadales bacterium]
MSNDSTPAYGQGDATFQAAGGEAGVRALVDSFYDIMSSDARFATIWSWHPKDPELSRDKLARFLCAWMGGPRRYNEKYGSISIPKAHQHLSVTPAERDQWLDCMGLALAEQGYPQALVDYLAEQLAVPANRVLQLRQRLDGESP